ncbi:lipocalin family protein, partial [Pseudomonas syringae pv. tagetis]
MPTRWRVRVTDRNQDITTDALNPADWMGVSIPYWEGPVRISRRQEGVG